jgi:hypothetical protein
MAPLRDRRRFRRRRRLTPPDVISQLMMAIPMCLLFELGLLLARFVTKRSRHLRRGPTAGACRRAGSRMEATVRRGDGQGDRRPRYVKQGATRSPTPERRHGGPRGSPHHDESQRQRPPQEGVFSAFSAFCRPGDGQPMPHRAPSSNSHRLPLGIVVQRSLSVSGTVAITATRSSGVVTR